jgi:hypothetical protein
MTIKEEISYAEGKLQEAKDREDYVNISWWNHQINTLKSFERVLEDGL